MKDFSVEKSKFFWGKIKRFRTNVLEYLRVNTNALYMIFLPTHRQFETIIITYNIYVVIKIVVITAWENKYKRLAL